MPSKNDNMIRFYRKKNDMTQQELRDNLSEEGLDISRSSVSMLENGRILPSWEEAQAIAEALGVLPSNLWHPEILDIICDPEE